MSWENEEDYVFHINGIMVYDFGPAIDLGDDPEYKDSNGTSKYDLVNLLGTKITYVYVLEEKWMHTMTLEEILLQGDTEYYYRLSINSIK